MANAILAVPTYFYPTRSDGALTGEAKRAPSGIPVAIVETVTRGKGRNKSTRVLVRTDAPQGWGEWSGAAMYAWVEQSAISGGTK